MTRREQLKFPALSQALGTLWGLVIRAALPGSGNTPARPWKMGAAQAHPAATPPWPGHPKPRTLQVPPGECVPAGQRGAQAAHRTEVLGWGRRPDSPGWAQCNHRVLTARSRQSPSATVAGEDGNGEAVCSHQSLQEADFPSPRSWEGKGQSSGAAWGGLSQCSGRWAILQGAQNPVATRRWEKLWRDASPAPTLSQATAPTA